MLSYHVPSKISMLLMQRRLKDAGKSRVSGMRAYWLMAQQSVQKQSIVISFGRGTSLNSKVVLSSWAKKATHFTRSSVDIPEVLVILSYTTTCLYQSKCFRVLRRMQVVVGRLR